ncbi:MAG: integrase arm-type DNA-binding domain-containing protein [Pseudomonadales bacterium]|jgi:integrase|nr:integrase arm-type DNA-binding domain-containing protein [Pseudomonadales bacterium]MDP7357662.1 integrase arm-type DNA-binding domain-containing protein [Pseudomonadales bacterium]MDP7595973.1 integrase arm-type DNA-binding domain-containing protein [Pseudomonadales bacterium]HJN52965.1 integrase arm-type DNA-binding domain-containing protein [Pseudomonadales bacterium]|tara:strand:+ start:58 stop:1263 length:1206 start_codon:yes stop_codon:yes gene_type:complete
MARKLERLSAVKVKRANEPSMVADGGGLYLRVGPTQAKSWIFRYMVDGKSTDMGLGALHTISLADARAAAAQCRLLKHKGIDPKTHRDESLRQAQLRDHQSITFETCAIEYIESHQAAWRNAKHANQWRSTISTYALPKFGNLPVQQVDTEEVLGCLQSIWQEKAETATRLRGRIEAILDWAKVKGYREGENPARWKGHLDNLLPSPAKIKNVKHHSALPYAEMPMFMQDLQQMEGMGARALEFTILTAVRTGETIGARWDEIKHDLWTIPGERMKGGKEHRVPLSDAVRSLLDDLPKTDDFVFPGQRTNKGLSNMAMLTLLRRMNRKDITVHGFHSTFRDWAEDRTNTPREIKELSLAHQVGSQVEAAYRRSDLLEKRRDLMDLWSQYCSDQSGKVVKIA